MCITNPRSHHHHHQHHHCHRHAERQRQVTDNRWMPRQRNAGKGLMLDTIPDLDQDLADQDDGDDD